MHIDDFCFPFPTRRAALLLLSYCRMRHLNHATNDDWVLAWSHEHGTSCRLFLENSSHNHSEQTPYQESKSWKNSWLTHLLSSRNGAKSAKSVEEKKNSVKIFMLRRVLCFSGASISNWFIYNRSAMEKRCLMPRDRQGYWWGCSRARCKKTVHPSNLRFYRGIIYWYLENKNMWKIFSGAIFFIGF